MMERAFGEPTELLPVDFQRLASLVRTATGINLKTGKESLVRSRLASRIRALELPTYTAYIDRLARDPQGAEMDTAIDLLTTNKTSFFREERHFDFLTEQLATPRSSLRIWSAACSTGEEPYSIAMTVAATRSVRDVRILATDICRDALATAQAASYTRANAADIPGPLASKYTDAPRGGDTVTIQPVVRDLVSFARLNLMQPWPMRGPFDFIFCRNVMIYFNDETREKLVERMRMLLAPGGYLLIGHAESLSGLRHGYTYDSPAVYRR